MEVLTKHQRDHGWQECQTQDHCCDQSKAHRESHWLKDDAFYSTHKEQGRIGNNDDSCRVHHRALHFTRR